MELAELPELHDACHVGNCALRRCTRMGICLHNRGDFRLQLDLLWHAARKFRSLMARTLSSRAQFAADSLDGWFDVGFAHGE